VTETASSKPVDLTDLEKSALVMMSIGQEAAAQVVKFLSPPEIDRLSVAMARISGVSNDAAASVLEEFVGRLQQKGSIGGGVGYVRVVLEKALGREQADSLVGRLTQEDQSSAMAGVKWQDPDVLAEMIKSEHPQIVAMIAAYLEPEQAQTLIQHLPDELVEQMIPRLAVLDTLSPTAVQELNESLEQLLSGKVHQARLSVGGVAVAAKLLNRIGAERAEHVLRTIGAIDPKLAETLNNNMFVFEDLFAIDNRSLQILLRAVDQKLLVAALKGVGPEVLDKVLSNLSQRAGDMLREEIEARGPMRLTEIEAARKEILAAAQALERDGKIILRTAPGDLVS
jgi:flagellar motor switch protein FliG